MKHDPIPTPPQPAAADEPQPNGPRWTNRKMAEFLRALAATHSVSEAAKAVGMSRQSASKLRSRLQGKAFDVAWNNAFSQSYVNLPYAALERALNGIEVPHYYKGELIGMSRRYDERLTVALLKLSSESKVLVVGGPVEAAERHGHRFGALIARIEAEGERAIADGDDDAFFRADSPNPSPLSGAEISAELRRFGPGSSK